MTDIRLANSGKVARKCACSGYVIGPENITNPIQAAAAVARHQNEAPHKEWDREAWQDRNTADVQVRVTLKRVA